MVLTRTPRKNTGLFKTLGVRSGEKMVISGEIFKNVKFELMFHNQIESNVFK